MSLSSVFIPNVDSSFSADFIAFHFKKQELGIVKRVDFVLKMDRRGLPYHAAYVHMEHWFINISSVHFQERLESGKEARIPYDDPKYWIVLKNTAQRPEMQGGRKVRINLNLIKKEDVGLGTNSSSGLESPKPSLFWVEEDYIQKLRDTIKYLEEKKNYEYFGIEPKYTEDKEEEMPLDMPYLIRDDGYGRFVCSSIAEEYENKVRDLIYEMEFLEMIEIDEIERATQIEEDYKYERSQLIMH
jgi:hypothetical protein